MKLIINEKIFEKFPELNLGIVIAKDIDNKGTNEEVINLIKEKQAEIRINFDKENLTQNPKIDAWKKAFSSFGAKPKKYRCSVENLYRMTLDNIELKHINKLVDIYNYISIKHIIPVGGDDIDKIEGNITLKLAEGNEIFKQLNSDEIKSPKEGEVIYIDDKEVLCRRWNWRECDKSKMSEDTKNAILVVEGLPPTTKEEVENIIEELGNLIEKHCQANITKYILNKDKKEIEF